MPNHEVILGQLVGPDAERDAVHIAIAPVVAAEHLSRGERVGFAGDDCTRVAPENLAQGIVAVGIVDPFFTKQIVHAEQRCWLFLFPQTITSLRHAWTHPAFPPELLVKVVEVASQDAAKFALGQEWITEVTNPEADEAYDAVAHKAADEAADAVEDAIQWIENFADTLGKSYGELMDEAASYAADGHFVYDNTEVYKSVDESQFVKFWQQYQVVVGKPIAVKYHQSFFVCAC